MKSTQSMWDELIEQLQQASGLGRLSELQVAEIKPYLVRLGMVQPFDWMSWREPYPSVVGVATIDLRTAVMHVTRICWAERFGWGILVCRHFRRDGMSLQKDQGSSRRKLGAEGRGLANRTPKYAQAGWDNNG
jgi:hypothetical protein